MAKSSLERPMLVGLVSGWGEGAIVSVAGVRVSWAGR